jgi:AraC family transcriptional regulator
MDLNPEICLLTEKKLVGKQMTMSFSNNRTGELWRSFMPHRKEIGNSNEPDLFSVEIYPEGFFDLFTPEATFDKWAAVEVTEFGDEPTGMEALALPCGIYAVFIYKGRSSEAQSFYRYIFETWLPSSGYILDNRPHFARMGEKYRNNDPESEEEIWIPVNAGTSGRISLADNTG